MAEDKQKDVKLYGFCLSPYCTLVHLALKLKGVSYDYVEEDLANKTAVLLQLNPVHKMVPVLVVDGKPMAEFVMKQEEFVGTTSNGSRPRHERLAACDVHLVISTITKCDDSAHGALAAKGGDGKAKASTVTQYIPESRVILEYIDEVWQHSPFFPSDPYLKAKARFWVDFFYQKMVPTSYAIIGAQGEALDKAVKEFIEQLIILENGIKEDFPEEGPFINGDSPGLLDIILSSVAVVPNLAHSQSWGANTAPLHGPGKAPYVLGVGPSLVHPVIRAARASVQPQSFVPQEQRR
ncbi:glutathione S-transferase U10 [Canna indica]|uniref:Glutathione S-transferase U10 n=1 Tax=Canna indica TaxID=4628 RepID=A0AAQ3L4M5_9LILI|nr:glutathione S-transferase U10 [Canna indica]